MIQKDDSYISDNPTHHLDRVLIVATSMGVYPQPITADLGAIVCKWAKTAFVDNLTLKHFLAGLIAHVGWRGNLPEFQGTGRLPQSSPPSCDEETTNPLTPAEEQFVTRNAASKAEQLLEWAHNARRNSRRLNAVLAGKKFPLVDGANVRFRKAKPAEAAKFREIRKRLEQATR